MRAGRSLLIALLLAGSGLPAQAQDRAMQLTEPPAQPGECWTSVVVPPQFEPVTETVEIAPAHERVEKTPARFEWVDKAVMVPAGVRRVVIRPAQYSVTEERVLVHPGDEVQHRIPAKTRLQSRRVVAATGPVLKPSASSGALCVVDAPTAYRQESAAVVVVPARTEWVERAARYRIVRHRTLVRPAETALQKVPDRQVTRRERVMVEPAGERRVSVSAVTVAQTREVLNTPARIEWRAVLCGSNADPKRIAAIQQALKTQGFDPGRTDGHFVAATDKAMVDWQRSAGLPANGFTVDSLRRLGLPTP
jgi:hypothetical protein